MSWRHAKLRTQVDQYLDGELPVARIAEFDSHLAACGACSAAVSVGRELKAALAALPAVEAPRSFKLTPRMTELSRPAPARQPARGLRFAQMTAGVTIVVLAALVTVDLRGGTSSADETSMMATGAAETSGRSSAGAGGAAASAQEQATGSNAAARDASSSPALPTLAGSSVGGQANAVPPQAPGAAGNKSAAPGPADASGSGDAFAGPHNRLDSPSPASADDRGPSWVRVFESGLLGLLLMAVATWIFLAKRSRRSYP